MHIPDLTHLQIVVLAALMDGERPGRHVREKLAESGKAMSGPAFYQLMSRLEDRCFIAGHYDQKIIAGQILKERIYKITVQGIRAWKDTHGFYPR